MSLIRNGFRVLFVLWAGSLWSLAIWVAPTLFFAQGDRHLAGVLAARLFSTETYLGLGVAALALLLPPFRRMRWLYAAAGLLALNELALRPLMESAHTHGTALGLSFGAWHGVSAGLYVLACLGALLVVWNENLR
ncbi:MAG: DUF4149 domain-containing protein [Steroidobacteraceae bacterium]|jgi:uncharacterized protein DUF4149